MPNPPNSLASAMRVWRVLFLGWRFN